MITGIMACDLNGGIGLNNGLPWPHHSEDMRFFKEQTINKTIIMGKNTFLSIGKPLPKRKNIVVSSTQFHYVDTISIVDAIALNDIVVIGGKTLYNAFIGKYDNFYLTTFKQKYNCDTYMNLDFLKEYIETIIVDENDYKISVYNKELIS